ncbi:MAG: 30S ribosomal protein S6 [Chloroflexi bacterium 13_1_40CM_4_68_4]|nr:MAG: 30S ribosomal protein S6 [Chloroflexi bacterium 13_1_40CM_4_68_4]
MRPYELMYLVQPMADDERIGAISERIQQTITGAGGKIEKVNIIGRRRLAYRIDRFRDGVYTVVDFQLEPQAAREIDRTIKLQEEILRHIITRRDMA